MVRPSKTGSVTGNFQRSTLRSGVRVLSENLPWVRSVSIGIWVDVGSRNERPEENGLSHFIEHLVFKGTKKRSAKQIASSLESRGGSLNAFTSKENTCFVARVLDRHIPEAVDVLADLVSSPTFSQSLMNREKGVICEEIKEAFDTPSDRIHDNFARAFWRNHALGQPILGGQEIISKMTRKRVVNYFQRHYRSNSMVVAASGAITHRRLLQLVRDKLDVSGGVVAIPESPTYTNQRNVTVEQTDGLQTHLCLGFPGLAYTDKQRASAMALHAHLGGGMSSVLFQKIREEKGLAYAVYTFHDFHRDAGLFGAYMATDQTHANQAFDMTLKEMKRVKKKRLTESRLDEVKAQLMGGFIIGMESTSNRMSRLARLEIMSGEYKTIDQTLRSIERIKTSDVLEIANRTIDEDKLALAVLGPVDPKSFDHVIG